MSSALRSAAAAAAAVAQGHVQDFSLGGKTAGPKAESWGRVIGEG